MSTWSEHLDTLYKLQDLAKQHGVQDPVPEMVIQSVVQIQRHLLPNLKDIFVRHQDDDPSFAMLATQFPTEPIPTPLWGQLTQAIGNLIIAMHLALPYVNEPLFSENFTDHIYPDYETVLVSVGKELLSIIQHHDLPTRLQQLREKLEEMFGFPFPKVTFQDDSELQPRAYTISIGGHLRQGTALHNKMLAISTTGQFPTMNGVECTDPIFGLPSKWIAPLMEQTAKKKGHVVLSPLGVIIAHIERFLRTRYHQLLTANVFTTLIQEHRDVASMYIALPKTEWVSIFQQCVRANISLGELPRMVDTVLKIQREIDVDVRQNGDYIYTNLRLRFPPRTLKYIMETGKVNIITLSDAVIDDLMGELDIEEGKLHIPVQQTLLKKLTETSLSTREQSPVVLCPDLLVPDLTRQLDRQGFKSPIYMDSEIPEHIHRIPVAPAITLD